MFNRNSYQNPSSRNSSAQKHNQSSFEISHSKNYSYFSEGISQNFMNNLLSPISKVEIEFSRDSSREDCGNFSSNYSNQELKISKNPSRGQSPVNNQNKKPYFLASKKLSMPSNPTFNDMNSKIQWNINPPRQITHEFSTAQRKQNQTINLFSKQQESEQQTEYSSRLSDNNKQEQYFSEKTIQANSSIQEKYSKLSRSYQQLEKEYERVKQENMRLKCSREELMNQNVKTKKEASYQIVNLSEEIQSLKEQIYRLEMSRQSQMVSGRTLSTNNLSQSNHRGCYTRDLSFYKARGSNPCANITQNGEINLFYVQQLQRQNDQLVRENRRLNDMIMKKLKHSVAE